jgi:5'-nucleotidase
MKLRVLLVAVLLTAASLHAADDRTVTIVHFSDYHAHAVPFYAHGQQRAAGIARAIAYLGQFASDPAALVLSGGDTLNVGAPPWSDMYGCADWPWLNGIVDAMAYGNHDADYGPDVFAACRELIDYPILGANVIAADGKPLFTVDGKPYAIFERGGLRIGVLAAGSDEFPTLIRPERLPSPGAHFAGRIETVRATVATLRGEERVDAVIVIGHAETDEDVALARAVPGIDLILGSHSHRLEPLRKIEGTGTWFVSPGQYLTHVSRIELRIAEDGTATARGTLVPMSRDLPVDRATARRVARMNTALRRDPRWSPLFRPFARIRVEFSTADGTMRDSALGRFVTDAIRNAGGADVALSTASSFREPLPPGRVRGIDLLAALPYDNEILLFELPGDALARILDHSASRRGSDYFAQVSGVRFRIDAARARDIEVLDRASGSWKPLDSSRTYTVATTDYLALTAAGYRDLFAAREPRSTGRFVREESRKALVAGRALYPPADQRISN